MVIAADPHAETLFPGQPGSYEWSITAARDETIRSISTSCGCSLPLTEGFKPFDLKENESRSVRLSYGNSLSGDYEVTVAAWGENRKEPIHKGAFVFGVRDALVLQASPKEHPWGRLDLSEGAPGVWMGKRSFTRGPHPKPWAAISCKIAANENQGWSATVSHEGNAVEFTAKLEPHGLCGIWSTKAIFSFQTVDGTALPYTPRLPLRALVPGPVEAQPRTAVIGTMESGTTTDSTVVIQPTAGWSARPASVEQEVDADRAAIHATMSLPMDVSGPWTASLTVSALSNATPGKANGAVIVKFSDGTRLRVPFLVTIAPKLPVP